jgi:hypothetical protein
MAIVCEDARGRVTFDVERGSGGTDDDACTWLFRVDQALRSARRWATGEWATYDTPTQ